MMSHGPCKYGQVYSATKLFTDFVSHGLKYELTEFGVDVCAWRAAGVKTKLIAGAHPDSAFDIFTSPLPDKYVERAF